MSQINLVTPIRSYSDAAKGYGGQDHKSVIVENIEESQYMTQPIVNALYNVSTLTYKLIEIGKDCFTIKKSNGEIYHFIVCGGSDEVTYNSCSDIKYILTSLVCYMDTTENKKNGIFAKLLDHSLFVGFNLNQYIKIVSQFKR